MEAYFFVPASKLQKISTIKNIEVENIIIDLEDAISYSEISRYLNDLLLKPELKKHFIRVPIINLQTTRIDLSILQKLQSSGFEKFMLPKLTSIHQFEKLIEKFAFKTHSLILLIENPKMLFEAPLILKEYPNLFHGISLGSHDYIAETGGSYNIENLELPRQLILNYARIAKILAIDIASMQINDLENLKTEIFDGFFKGFDAKLLIHPKQLNFFKQIQFYDAKEYEWAKKVLKELSLVKSIEDFKPVVIDGAAVERAHLKRAHKIVNWFEKK